MTASQRIDLSSAAVRFVVVFGEGGLSVEQLGLPGHLSWLASGSASPLFEVHTGGYTVTGDRALELQGIDVTQIDEKASRHDVRLFHQASGLAVRWHVVTYGEAGVLEQWVSLENKGVAPISVDRVDSVSLDLPGADYDLLSFTSAWGAEFEEVRERLGGARRLETLKGRSSQGQHPWFALVGENGALLSGSAMWSGNWVFRFEPLPSGHWRLSGGLHDQGFQKFLDPQEVMESPHVALALGRDADLNTVSTGMARVGRRYWYPRNPLSDLLAVEWNHWWSYIDRYIDQDRFDANAEAAAGLGMEVCTLDAGWFGPPEAGTHWYDYRGDWDQVNSTRFPSGIRALSDRVHDRGMRFGLWCEIEALGERARLGTTRPDFPALREGKRLGYVCFGNPAVQEWALETLSRLIEDYRCDWVKLDFNVDPGLGCDRTDHGHGPGDGLFEHYRGYYRMLEQVRRRHPEVLLENCSSGGLRIDLGILSQTHSTFLSDPDWPEHDLQLFWGATTMLAPDRCLHWGWGEWVESKHPNQTFDPRDPNLEPEQLDYYTRISMLGGFGFSQKLPELPAWVAERYRHHVRTYKDLVRRFVREADLYRLTEQPKRHGRGDRWAGFQYRMPDGVENLVFAFRLQGGEPERALRLRCLEAERAYTVRWITADRLERRSGEELTGAGLHVAGLGQEGSEIFLIR
jgi:alpha-galactosidase